MYIVHTFMTTALHEFSPHKSQFYRICRQAEEAAKIFLTHSSYKIYGFWRRIDATERNPFFKEKRNKIMKQYLQILVMVIEQNGILIVKSSKNNLEIFSIKISTLILPVSEGNCMCKILQ